MLSIATIESTYEQSYSNMMIRPAILKDAKALAKSIIICKPQYQFVADRVNPKMPWYMVGITHMMERNGHFDGHLHNGDPLTARTIHYPAGRPLKDSVSKLGYTWTESAIDALTLPWIGYHKAERWNLKLILYRLEKWNGLAYARKGLYTPYLWSGTTFYEKGKFVEIPDPERPGKFKAVYNPDLVSKQIGAAVLLRLVTDKTMGVAQ